MSNPPTPPDQHSDAVPHPALESIPDQRVSALVALGETGRDTTPARERAPAPRPAPSISQSAVPAALDPTTSPFAQALAFGDRILADEDRTRRARSLLARGLVWGFGLIVAAALCLVALVIAGITCLSAGLLELGPAGGHLYIVLGTACLGGGAIVGALVRRAARSLWTRTRPNQLAKDGEDVAGAGR